MRIPSNWTVTKNENHVNDRYVFRDESKIVLMLDICTYKSSRKQMGDYQPLSSDSIIFNSFSRVVMPDVYRYIQDDGLYVMQRVYLKNLASRSDDDEIFEFEFVYNPLDSAECVKIVNSLASLKSVPDDIFEPVEFIYWDYDLSKVDNAPSINEFLCKGCSLQDSVVNQNESVKYFDCYVDSLSYRFVSRSNVTLDVLSAVDVSRKKDSSLKRCKGILEWEIPCNVGTMCDGISYRCPRETTFSSCDLKKNGNVWVYDEIESLPGLHTVSYKHADLYFVNDKVDHLHYSRYDKRDLTK